MLNFKTSSFAPTAVLLLLVGLASAQNTLTLSEIPNVVVLTVPDKAAALQVDLQHLAINSNTLRRDAEGRSLEASDSHGWVFSSYLYPVDQGLDSKALREQQLAGMKQGLAKKGMTPTGVKTYQNGPIAMLEYSIEEFQGKRVNQKNVFGYIVSGGLGLDFHISKISFVPEDQKFMDEMVGGIKLIPGYQPDSKLLYQYGSVFYVQENWARAAQEYQKALDLEKVRRQLPATEWTVLVDNLGLAYAMSGDLTKARSIFAYGLQQDATYPMFHYNMACADAETGDLDGALEQLKTAFQYKGNSLAGEGIPDPTKDDSFKRYLADAKFQRLVKDFCPSSTKTEGGWICN